MQWKEIIFLTWKSFFSVESNEGDKILFSSPPPDPLRYVNAASINCNSAHYNDPSAALSDFFCIAYKAESTAHYQ